MQGDDGDVIFCQLQQPLCSRVSVRNAARRMENQRMVGDNELCAEGNCLFHHSIRHIQREQNLADRCLQTTDLEA